MFMNFIKIRDKTGISAGLVEKGKMWEWRTFDGKERKDLGWTMKM